MGLRHERVRHPPRLLPPGRGRCALVHRPELCQWKRCQRRELSEFRLAPELRLFWIAPGDTDFGFLCTAFVAGERCGASAVQAPDGVSVQYSNETAAWARGRGLSGPCAGW